MTSVNCRSCRTSLMSSWAFLCLARGYLARTYREVFAYGVEFQEGLFMIKMVRPTRETLKLHCGSLVARPSLTVVFSVLAITIVVLATLSWFQRIQIEESRSAQVILNQIAMVTREINNLTWTALHQQDLTPEADSEMRAARQALP